MTQPTIMIVEDETVVAEDIRSSLKGLGFGVSAVAPSAEEAISRVKDKNTDLVLMDIKLKGDMDGIDGAQEIRTRFNLPVVYLTSHADEEVLQRAKLTEPFGYIIKPFKEKELRTAIEIALYKHQAEQATRLAHSELDQIFQTATDGIRVVDKDYNVLRVNKTFVGLSGRTEAEAVGKKCYEGFPGPTCHTSQCPLSRVLGGDERVEHEVEKGRPDGIKVPCIVTAAPFRGPSGELIGMVESFTDMTDRKQAEDALRASEEKYRSLHFHMNEGVCLQDIVYDESGKSVDYIVTDINSSFESITGLSREKAIGAKASELYGTGGPPYMDVYSEVVDSGKPTSFEAHFPPMQKHFHISVFSPGKGKFATVFSDVTEHKLAEEALTESEEKYRTFVENFQGIAYRGNIGFMPIFFHGAVEAITGYAEDEFIHGRPRWDQIIHPQDFPKLLDSVEKIRLTPGYRADREYRIIRKDGQTTWVRELIQNICDDTGKPVTVQGSIYDISDRKQVEEEREVLIAELEAKNSELEQFTYTVSHDLKSPLITIKGFLGMLERHMAKGSAKQIKTDIAYISDAATNMEHLLGDLLKLSRIGRVVNPPEEVELGKLVRQIVNMLTGRVSEKGIKVKIAPDLPVVYGDRPRLTEVLENLVDNATKFAGDQPEPRIEISSRREGEETVFCVWDNGIGIDPKYHDKVFGLFDKLNQKAEGTGVGLAIVKRIIEVHGGHIWIESGGDGKGTTFCFTIPEKPELPD